MKRYSDIIKQEAINLYRAGTPVAEIVISLSISRSTVYKWLKEQNIVPPDLTKSGGLRGSLKSCKALIAMSILRLTKNSTR